MPEEIYTSKDYCRLVEELEETKRELKELMRNYMVLINFYSIPDSHIGLLVADLVSREILKQKNISDQAGF